MRNMDKLKRKRGRPAEPGLERYSLTLDRELAEWGKGQPGGLSRLLRELLRKAKAEAPGDGCQ